MPPLAWMTLPSDLCSKAGYRLDLGLLCDIPDASDLAFFDALLNDGQFCKKAVGFGRDFCVQGMVNGQDLCRQDFDFKFSAVLYDLLDYSKRDCAIADVVPRFQLVDVEMLETTAQQFEDVLGIFSMLFSEVKIEFDCLSSGCDMKIIKNNDAIKGNHFYTDLYDAEVCVELSKVSNEVTLTKRCPPIVEITEIRYNEVDLLISNLYCDEIFLSIKGIATTMRCFTQVLTTTIQNLLSGTHYVLRVSTADDCCVDVEFTTQARPAPKLLVTSVSLNTATVYISDAPHGQMIFYLKTHEDIAVHVHDGSKTKLFRDLAANTEYVVHCKVRNYRMSA